MSAYAAGYRGLGTEQGGWTQVIGANLQPLTFVAPGGTVKRTQTDAQRREQAERYALIKENEELKARLAPSVLTVEPGPPGQRVGQRFSLQSIPWWGWVAAGVIAWQMFGGRR